MKLLIMLLTFSFSSIVLANPELYQMTTCLKELDRTSFYKRNYDIFFFESKSTQAFYTFEKNKLGYYDISNLKNDGESKYYSLRLNPVSGDEYQFYFLWQNSEFYPLNQSEFNQDATLKKFSIFNRTKIQVDSVLKQSTESEFRILLISSIGESTERLYKFIIANQFDREYTAKVKRAKVFCEKIKSIDGMSQILANLETH